MTKTLAYRAVERVIRGFSNHRRIQILELLDGHEVPLSLAEIAKLCRIDFRVASEHVRRLYLPGLVSKRNKGRLVEHEITALGERALAFMRSLE